MKLGKWRLEVRKNITDFFWANIIYCYLRLILDACIVNQKELSMFYVPEVQHVACDSRGI